MFFSVSYLIGFPIAVQSSYSTVYKLSLTVAINLVQSPKLFKLNDAQRGLASAKKTAGNINCVTGVRLQNYGKPSLYQK